MVVMRSEIRRFRSEILSDLKAIQAKKFKKATAYNQGTGRGTSVLELVAAFKKASGKKIPIKLCPRRPGDATAVYASTERTEKELGWKLCSQ